MSNRHNAPRLGDIVAPRAEDLRLGEEEKYEEQLVTALCKHYGISTAHRNDMKREVENASGQFRLTFDVWHQEFPTFPVYLKAALIRNISRQSPLSKIMSNFAGCDFVRAYYSFMEECHEERSHRPCALVFRWPMLAGRGNPPTGLVLTNMLPTWEVPGVRIAWVPQKEANCEPLFVRELNVFLREIDHGYPGGRWKPDEDL